MPAPALRFLPLTPARWRDVAALFGPRGACAGCWCMWWRRPRADWRRGRGAGNRRAFRRLVASGRVPGVLAYAGREPVGWCAAAPREEYPALARSRILRPVDARPVPDVFVFTGLASSFQRAGFAEVARRSRSRPIMRRQVRGAADSGMVRAR